MTRSLYWKQKDVAEQVDISWRSLSVDPYASRFAGTVVGWECFNVNLDVKSYRTVVVMNRGRKIQ